MANTVELTSGQLLPVLGLGTLRSGKGEVGKAVISAIKAGYRLIDCAEAHQLGALQLLQLI
jgi:alcohol dehydrogenase (NADP+)